MQSCFACKFWGQDLGNTIGKFLDTCDIVDVGEAQYCLESLAAVARVCPSLLHPTHNSCLPDTKFGLLVLIP